MAILAQGSSYVEVKPSSRCPSRVQHAAMDMVPSSTWRHTLHARQCAGRVWAQEDPDGTLHETDSCIEVAPYKHGKLFSMDNRRLYCLKESFSAGRMIWVKKYPSVAAYDADHPKSTSWGSKFSTINDGVSVVLLPRGFKRNVLHGKEFRCIQLSPSQDIMRAPNMLDLDELTILERGVM